MTTTKGIKLRLNQLCNSHNRFPNRDVRVNCLFEREQVEKDQLFTNPQSGLWQHGALWHRTLAVRQLSSLQVIWQKACLLFASESSL